MGVAERINTLENPEHRDFVDSEVSKYAGCAYELISRQSVEANVYDDELVNELFGECVLLSKEIHGKIDEAFEAAKKKAALIKEQQALPPIDTFPEAIIPPSDVSDDVRAFVLKGEERIDRLFKSVGLGVKAFDSMSEIERYIHTELYSPIKDYALSGLVEIDDRQLNTIVDRFNNYLLLTNVAPWFVELGFKLASTPDFEGDIRVRIESLISRRVYPKLLIKRHDVLFAHKALVVYLATLVIFPYSAAVLGSLWVSVFMQHEMIDRY